jgi:uncharacterized membrane protein
MKDLTALSTETLEAMKGRLTNWIVYIAVLDAVVVGVFVWFFTTRSPAQVLPFVPILMLPAIAIVPFIIRAGAIRRELVRRRN